MKKCILPFLILFLAHSLSGQEISGTYEFNQNLDTGASLQVVAGKSDEVEITDGDRITVIRVDEANGLVYYKYWLSEDPDQKIADLYNDNVFTLPLSQFQQVTVPLYRRYKGASVGAYTVPFRLRGIGGGDDPFDFESSLSLQANLVFGWGSNYSQTSLFDTSIGIGLTGVNLNTNNSSVQQSRTASALTISLGGLIKPTEYANIGVFLGWDFLGASDKEVNWFYDDDAWLGVGLNINFNEITTSKPAKE